MFPRRLGGQEKAEQKLYEISAKIVQKKGENKRAQLYKMTRCTTRKVCRRAIKKLLLLLIPCKTIKYNTIQMQYLGRLKPQLGHKNAKKATFFTRQ